ncbi:ABC transporter permease, partial [Thioclava sp. BHET1]
MRSVGPVLSMLVAIVVLWYGAAVWMNAQWVRDQAARAGTQVSFV